MGRVWYCKVGEADPLDVPQGGDFPMRQAIAEAYKRVVGSEPQFIFSGWGAELTEPERAVVEDRLPASFQDSRGRSEQFCGRDDLEPHHPHSWARLPDGSYGDYDDEERDIVWCGGSNQGARRGG